MSSVNMNGRRASLADQIDRLDGMIDGLAEGLNEAVATEVREAVGLAVQQALGQVLRELLTNPELLARLQDARGVPVLGHSNKQAAATFRLSPGRVSQIRQRLCREWFARHGEKAPFED